MKKLIVPVVGDAPRCLGCGAKLNVICGRDFPGPGDWNVCASCLAVHRFVDDKFALRLVLAEELERCAAELEPKDLDLLRGCFAARVGQKGAVS